MDMMDINSIEFCSPAWNPQAAQTSTPLISCSGQGQGLTALEMGALQNLMEQILFLYPTATFVKTFCEFTPESLPLARG